MRSICAAECVAKSWKEASHGDFEIVAAAFGFEIGCAAGKPAKHRRVRVLFGSYGCLPLRAGCRSEVSSNGIGDVHTVDCVGTLACAGAFLVIDSVHSAHNTGSQQRRALKVLCP